MVGKSIFTFMILAAIAAGSAAGLTDDDISDYEAALADGETVTLDDGTTVAGDASINLDGSIDCPGACVVNDIEFDYADGIIFNDDGTFDADEYKTDAGVFVGASGCSDTGCREVELFQAGNSTVHAGQNLVIDGDSFTVDSAASFRCNSLSAVSIMSGSCSGDSIEIGYASSISYSGTYITGATGFGSDGVLTTLDSADYVQAGDSILTDVDDVTIFSGDDGVMHAEATSGADDNELVVGDASVIADSGEGFDVNFNGYYDALYELQAGSSDEKKRSILKLLPDAALSLMNLIKEVRNKELLDIVKEKLYDTLLPGTGGDIEPEPETEIEVGDLQVESTITTDDQIDVLLSDESVSLDGGSSVYIADGMVQGGTFGERTRYENHDTGRFSPPLALYVPDGQEMSVQIIRSDDQVPFTECDHCGIIDYVDHTIMLRGMFELERLQDDLPIFTDIIWSGSDNNRFFMQMDDDMDVAVDVDFSGDDARFYTMDLEVMKKDGKTYYRFQHSNTPYVINRLGNIQFFPDNSLIRSGDDNTFSMYSKPASDEFLRDYDSWVRQAGQNTRT